MTSQRKLHKHIYYCALPGNVSKEIITWHPLNALKQMKTHCNLHSYWKDLQQCTLWSFMLATPYGGYKMQLCLKNWSTTIDKCEKHCCLWELVGDGRYMVNLSSYAPLTSKLWFQIYIPHCQWCIGVLLPPHLQQHLVWKGFLFLLIRWAL